MNSRLSVSGLLLGACLFAGVPFSAQASGALLKSSSEITALSVAPRKQKQAVNLDSAASALFADPLLTKLKRRTSEKDIASCPDADLRALALQLHRKEYSQKFRVAHFEPVYSPEALGRLLHIGNGYSRYQHVTGMALGPGRHIVVVEGLKEGSPLALRIAELYAPKQGDKDWSLHSETYPLKNGINVIEKKTDWVGLAYMDYYFDQPEQENNIRVHFVTGAVNGYFDAAHDTNADWDVLLSRAVYPVFDAVGSNVHLAYPVADLKRYAAGKGRELISVYEELVGHQQEIIGWKKYKRIPKNKIFARVNYGYYMFRDGNGVAFKFDTMSRVADPDHMRHRDEDACWGFAHEVGHVHQLRPYLSWGGLGETSNNICSRYCTQVYGYKNRLAAAFEKAEKNFLEDGMAGKVSGVRRSSGMADSVICAAKGPKADYALSYLEVDVFERLVPFWKLQCYFVKNGKPDFYPDLYEKMRRSEEEHPELAKLSRSENVVPFQLNFVRGASEVAGINLYPYFEAFGFFRLLKLTYGDYGTYHYHLTAEMRDAFKAEMDQMVRDGKLRALTDAELQAMLHAEE